VIRTAHPACLARLALALALAACGDGTGSSADAPDAPIAPDAAPIFPTTCDGPCRTTDLTATFGATTRQLDHAFYGITSTATGMTLHVEAHRGGSMACPTQTSPTPDYTLVLGRVPVPTSTTPLTSRADLLDFTGDLLGGNQVGAEATTVELTPVAANLTGPDGLVALDLALTFDNGTLSGHLFATHCPSLDASE
jgi:hypothetical protein